MRKFSWAIALLLAVSFVDTVRASPTQEVTNYYYDCALNQVGWETHACNNQRYSSGTLAGAYRWEVTMGCSDFDYSAQWYYWDGTDWVPFEGPPGPNC